MTAKRRKELENAGYRDCIYALSECVDWTREQLLDYIGSCCNGLTDIFESGRWQPYHTGCERAYQEWTDKLS